MPVNDLYANDIKAGKRLKLDFGSMQDNDIRDLTDTVEATMGSALADQMRTDWARTRRGEIKGTITLDTNLYPRTPPGGDGLAGMLSSAIGAGKAVGNWATSPISSLAQRGIEEASKAVGAGANKLFGVPPQETDAGEAPFGGTPALVPNPMRAIAPLGLPGVPSTVPVQTGQTSPKGGQAVGARLLSGAAQAPAQVALALASDLNTPLGLGMTAAGLPVAQRAIAAAGKMAGAALQVGGHGARNLVEMMGMPPEVYDAGVNALARFTRPESLRDARQVFNMQSNMDRYEAQDWFRGIVSVTDSVEREHIMQSIDLANQGRVSSLEQMRHEVNEYARTGMLPNNADAHVAALLGDTAQAKIIMKAADHSLQRFAQRVPEDISEVISNVEKGRAFALMPEEKKAIADETLARFDNLRARIVASKFRGREAFSTHEGTYVPDLYQQHELEVGARENLGGSRPGRVQRPGGERLKTRDLTDLAAKREAGLMSQYDLRVYKGMMQETYMANYGEFLQSIAQQPSLASADAIRGWKLLEGREYGALNNRYVHPAVKLELDGMFKRPGEAEQVVTKYLNYFKKAVTIWNPPVHVGNFVSNMFMMDAGGVGMVKDMGGMREALKSLRAGDATFKKIASTGLLDETEFGPQHARDVMDMMRAAIHENDKGDAAAIDALGRILAEGPKRKAMNWASPSQIYHSEESLFKYMMAHIAYTKGIASHGVPKGDLLAAARHAEKWLINWSDVPWAVREARTGFPGALATPFVTFQAKAMPLAVETFVRNPQKYVKWHALFQGLNRSGMNAAGLSDQDYQEFRMLRAENDRWQFMKPMVSLAPMLVLPTRGPNGEVYAIDASRFTFFGQPFQPRGLPMMGLGPAVSAGLGAAGYGPDGRQLFEPDAQNQLGPVKLFPPMWARRLQAAASASAVIPPFAKRLAIGGLSAMGPKFSPMGPENAAATGLELLGSTGARTQEGTLQGPIRQLASALAFSPEEVNVSRARVRAKMLEAKRNGATANQIGADAMRRARAR